MNTHQTPIQLRFSDIDVLGHVNNARFATFMEVARVKYFNEVTRGIIDWKKLGFLLARVETDFLMPVFFQDVLTVHTHVSHIGTKSFTMEYEFRVEGDAGSIVKARGKSVQVAYSFESESSVPVPEIWLERIRAYHGEGL